MIKVSVEVDTVEEMRRAIEIFNECNIKVGEDIKISLIAKDLTHTSDKST